MNRHGYSTYRVRGGGELGAVGPGVKGQQHAFFAIALRLRLLRLRVAAVVVLVFGLGLVSVFRSFRFAACLEARNRNSFSTRSSTRKIILK